MIYDYPLTGGRTEHMPHFVADYYIAYANAIGSPITNMKLQKLLYYTLAWYVTTFEKNLFRGDFQAWIHGPVFPEVYNEYKGFEGRPIDRPDLTEAKLEEMNKVVVFRDLGKSLNYVIAKYFSMDDYALEILVTGEFPWIAAREGLAPNVPSTKKISQAFISSYYSQFLEDGV